MVSVVKSIYLLTYLPTCIIYVKTPTWSLIFSVPDLRLRSTNQIIKSRC